MKPVLLRVKGLHSFRVEQVVDFSKLTEGGVFGIFGPTGSGKSSILDAITLALYGKVERSEGNNIQGILNLSEQDLRVIFVFELQSSAGRRRFRVERIYRRSETYSVESREAKLVEISGGEEFIIAAKARAVTEKIVELTGLNADDFTRAVVLPQGRFAEFMRLTPSHRAKMLERLFGLERFGRNLTERIAKGCERLSADKRVLMSRIEGIGDASAEALSTCDLQLKILQKKLLDAEQVFVTAQNEFRVWDDVMRWQSELAQIEVQIETFEEKQLEINRLRLELDAARKADRVKPFFDTLSASAEVKNKTGKVLEDFVRTIEQTAAVHKEKVALLERIRLQRNEEMPRLQESRVRAEESVLLDAEIKRGMRERQVIEREFLLAQEQEKIAATEVVNLQRNLDVDKTVQKSVMDKLTAVRTDVRYREQVMQAQAAFVVSKSALMEVERARKEKQVAEELLARSETEAQREALALKRHVEALQNAKAELETCRNEPHESDAELRSALGSLDELRTFVMQARQMMEMVERLRVERDRRQAEHDRYKLVAERVRLLLTEHERTLVEAEKSVKQTRESRELAQQKQICAVLASQLQTNVPCGVCGSLEHPSPVTSSETLSLQRFEKSQADAERVEERLKRDIAKLRDEESGARIELRAAEVLLTDARARFSEAEAIKNGALARFPAQLGPHSGVIDARVLENVTESEARKLRDREKILERWLERLGAAQRKLEAAQTAHFNLQSALTAGEKSVAVANSRLSSANATLIEKEIALKNKLNELDSARKDLLVDRIDEEVRSLQKRDVEFQKLSLQLENLLARIETMERDVTKAQSDLETLRARKSEIQVRLNALLKDETEKSLKLKSITNGVAPDKVVDKINSEIAALGRAEEMAEHEVRRAQERLDDIRLQLEKTRIEHDLAIRLIEETERKVRSELNLVGLSPSLETVRSAARSPEAMRTLEQTIEGYRRELDRLLQERARLHKLLLNRRLSVDDWQSYQKILSDAEANRTELSVEIGGARERFERLAERHAEWMRLHNDLLVMERKLEQHEALKKVLDGLAFVDFLAREQLESITKAASQRLALLSRFRYTLRVDSSGGFHIRDNANGGLTRPVASLSGGETFLASLSLALALSVQIQIHGEYPLEFFFLDEGFGSLDVDLIETVMTSLEQLRLQNMHIGLISHVPALRDRVQRRVIVEPPDELGNGSVIRLEIA